MRPDPGRLDRLRKCRAQVSVDSSGVLHGCSDCAEPATSRSYALLQFTRRGLADAQGSVTVPYRLLDFRGSPELDRVNAQRGP